MRLGLFGPAFDLFCNFLLVLSNFASDNKIVLSQNALNVLREIFIKTEVVSTLDMQLE